MADDHTGPLLAGGCKPSFGLTSYHMGEEIHISHHCVCFLHSLHDAAAGLMNPVFTFGSCHLHNPSYSTR